MKRIIGVYLSLSVLWLAGTCGEANASKAQDASATKSETALIVIEGATLVRQITDERVIESIRREYDLDVFDSQRPFTVETVQIEEFEGFQYLTAYAKDKDGQLSSSSRPYMPDSMPGYSPKANH